MKHVDRMQSWATACGDTLLFMAATLASCGRTSTSSDLPLLQGSSAVLQATAAHLLEMLQLPALESIKTSSCGPTPGNNDHRTVIRKQDQYGRTENDFLSSM